MAEDKEATAELIRLADFLGPVRDNRISEIYVAVSSLFQHHNDAFSARERSLATDILRRLSKDVEMSIRVALAEQVAERDDVPRELAILLADDRIEVARLVLARSPLLHEEDLLGIIEASSDDHRIAVAERPSIGERISDALAHCACEAVIIALLRNRSAAIAETTFGRLVERARESEALHAPLAGRDDLPGVLALRLYEWVSGGLKQALCRRYPEIAPTLGPVLEATTQALQQSFASAAEISAAKLVAKLSIAGQLRASFLMRSLHQYQMELFEHGFAALLQMDVQIIRKALYEQNPVVVALACRAVGIDRSVFMTVFTLSRQQRKVALTLSETDRLAIDAVFSQVPKTDALTRLRQAAA